MTPNLIGLTGRADAGKDTIAAKLCKLYGYHRVAFADALKTSAYNADPYIDTGDGGPIFRRLSSLVDVFGWDALKRDCPDARRFLQRHGVAMRDMLPGCWITIAAAAVQAHLDADRSVVVTDVRFPDEVAAVKAWGGIVARVNRTGAGLTDGNAGHVSETLVDTLDVDLDVANDCDGASALTLLATHLDHLATVGPFA